MIVYQTDYSSCSLAANSAYSSDTTSTYAQDRYCTFSSIKTASCCSKYPNQSSSFVRRMLLEEEKILDLKYTILDAPPSEFDERGSSVSSNSGSCYSCLSEEVATDRLLLILDIQMKSVNFSSILSPTERAIVVELKRKQIRDKLQRRAITTTPIEANETTRQSIKDNKVAIKSIDNRHANIYDEKITCSIELSPTLMITAESVESNYCTNNKCNFSPDNSARCSKHLATVVQQYATAAGYKVDASVQTNWSLCNSSSNSSSHIGELENIFTSGADISSSSDERVIFSPFSNITDTSCNELCNTEFSTNDFDELNTYKQSAVQRKLGNSLNNSFDDKFRSMQTLETSYYSFLSKRGNSPVIMPNIRQNGIPGNGSDENNAVCKSSSSFIYDFKYDRDTQYYDSEIFSLNGSKWRISIIKQQAISSRNAEDNINNKSRYVYQLRLMNLHRDDIALNSVTFYLYTLLRPHFEKTFYNVKFRSIKSAITYQLSESVFFKYVEYGQIKIGVSIIVD